MNLLCIVLHAAQPLHKQNLMIQKALRNFTDLRLRENKGKI